MIDEDKLKQENARVQDALATELAKEKIVYLLGAGFSAPLGIPVMKEFYGRFVFSDIRCLILMPTSKTCCELQPLKVQTSSV